MEYKPVSPYQKDPYGAQSIMTASPCELVARLYEAAIMNLRKAVLCIEENDVKGRWEATRKAFDIIEHLTLTLNMDEGGQIADNLSQLYEFMMRRLMDVDVKNDPKAAQDVIELLAPLHKAWRELDEQMRTKGATAAGPAPARPAKGENNEQEKRVSSTA